MAIYNGPLSGPRGPEGARCRHTITVPIDPTWAGVPWEMVDFCQKTAILLLHRPFLPQNGDFFELLTNKFSHVSIRFFDLLGIAVVFLEILVHF